MVDRTAALERLETGPPGSEGAVDEGRLAFVGALCRPGALQPGVARIVEAHAPAVVATVRAGLGNPEARLRRAACDVLASPSFPVLVDGAHAFSAVDAALALAGPAEPDVDVRAAACRALGFLAKSTGLGAEVSTGSRVGMRMPPLGVIAAWCD